MAESNLVKDTLTHKIIGYCYEVHKELGSGFLEKIYARALILQFSKENLKFEYEKEFTVLFQGQSVGKFRCDFLVENKIIVELKSVTGIMPKLFQSQVISYLKASKVKTGLLINFGNTSCEVKRFSV
ncbi:GxxExxY protein [Pedobacter puniceum]|uniref:GxxExxY protein n=1 Tax=Pedobacter puniceum TaxID=2666136 RepID=A0A7K0FT47_9SPHI|nr:GxxExxY protein [Pedobacter puniceum]MRX48257.1 GxxExxY protein [Pedobacter puniceum]